MATALELIGIKLLHAIKPLLGVKLMRILFSFLHANGLDVVNLLGMKSQMSTVKTANLPTHANDMVVLNLLGMDKTMSTVRDDVETTNLFIHANGMDVLELLGMDNPMSTVRDDVEMRNSPSLIRSRRYPPSLIISLLSASIQPAPDLHSKGSLATAVDSRVVSSSLDLIHNLFIQTTLDVRMKKLNKWLLNKPNTS